MITHLYWPSHSIHSYYFYLSLSSFLFCIFTLTSICVKSNPATQNHMHTHRDLKTGLKMTYRQLWYVVAFHIELFHVLTVGKGSGYAGQTIVPSHIQNMPCHKGQMYFQHDDYEYYLTWSSSHASLVKGKNQIYFHYLLFHQEGYSELLPFFRTAVQLADFFRFFILD